MGTASNRIDGSGSSLIIVGRPGVKMDGLEQQSLRFAQFLRDTVDAYTRRQFTIASQTRDGFSLFLHEIPEVPGIELIRSSASLDVSAVVLGVPRPTAKPTKPTAWSGEKVSDLEMRRYEVELERWQSHSSLYEKLFRAQSISESMELVFASILVATDREGEEYRRHILKIDCEVKLADKDGRLLVTLRDSPSVEANWLPGTWREKILSGPDDHEALLEIENLSGCEEKVRELISKFGTRAFSLKSTQEQTAEGTIGVGNFPALLLRRRDSSATLKLIEQIVQELSDGAEPSEPFKMIVSSQYKPSLLEHRDQIAALPLEANEEQRETILRTLTERHVVIQGPPGTGKTHTIANLAALLMAEGRRVLITAENDHALTEVQSKLPQGMQALLLPFFRDAGSAPLERSVNQLVQAHGRREFKTTTKNDLANSEDELKSLKKNRDEVELRLIEARELDRSVHDIGGHQLTISGHLKLIRTRQAELEIIDRYLSSTGHVLDEVPTNFTSLEKQVSEDDLELAEYRFPEDTPSPEEFANELNEFRSQLNHLRGPFEVDYSPLADRIAELVATAQRLNKWPQVNWHEVPFSETQYQDFSRAAKRSQQELDLAVGLHRVDLESALKLLEAFCSLTGPLSKQDLNQLRILMDRSGDSESEGVAEIPLGDPSLFIEIYSDITAATALISNDKTGLLASLVDESITDSTAVLGPAIDEIRRLRPKLVEPAGLAVTIIGQSRPVAELATEARALLQHLRDGGSFKGIFGASRAAKNARNLLETVLVGGSRIDTPEEVERAVQVLEVWENREVAKSWLATFLSRHVEDSEVLALMGIVDELPGHATFVRSVHERVCRGIDSAFVRTTSTQKLLEGVHSAASKQISLILGPLKEAHIGFDGQILYTGEPVISRDVALKVVSHLRATRERFDLFEKVPSSWRMAINPLDKGSSDALREALETAAEVAKTPQWARTSPVSPQAFIELAELAETDRKRKALLAGHLQFQEDLRGQIRRCAPVSPSTSLMAEAVDKEDPRLYRDAFNGVESEKKRASEARRLSAYKQNLLEVHPDLWLAFLSADENATDIIQRLTELEEIRDHRRKVTALSSSIVTIEEIHANLATLYKQIQILEAKISQARCWLNAIERLESDRKLASALSALVSAISSVPKTRTAKTYARKARGVRDATKAASPAIPCWLMSIDRIPEVLGDFGDVERFDVVIVDEASQAWFSSLFLYALADQVIIVGDDMQTSPSAGGVLGEDELIAIVRQHIPWHRLATQVGDDLSIYDVASSMTAPVTLVDHFRCVPEIINISNEMSYRPKGKSLLPIRTHSNEQLEPVIRVRVEGERSTSSAPNLQEIDELVLQVIQCIADPRYKNKSFGVVVAGTQPNAHLKRLREELLLNVGPREMTSRKMKVGSAGEFQGSERDVMFLSLVDAPPVGGRLRTRPLEYTGRNRKFVQQLNVAASRARDQLWIFHSFGPEDLGESDARHKLLEIRNPISADLGSELAKCNGFESDVVLKIHQFMPDVQIRTQVEALGYFIDIVLTHPSGLRLAVECDGDRWHLDDSSLRSDLYRQRALERVGWRFYRFLSSEWYSDEQPHLMRIQELLNSDQLAGIPQPVIELSKLRTPPNPNPASQESRLDEFDLFSEIDTTKKEVPELQVFDGPVSQFLNWIDGQSSSASRAAKNNPAEEVDDIEFTDVPEAMADGRFSVERIAGDQIQGKLFELTDGVKKELQAARREDPAQSSTKSDGRPSWSRRDPPTPSVPKSRSEKQSKNRELADELRKLGKSRHGSVWRHAKELLDSGLSVKEAARQARGDDDE